MVLTDRDRLASWWEGNILWRLGYRWFVLRHWVRTRPDRLAWWLAWHLPRKVTLYAFVRVYAVLGDCGNDYEQAYKRWDAGEGK